MALLAVLALACGRGDEPVHESAETPQVPGVETVVATREGVRDTVEAFASVSPAGEPPEVRDAHATLVEAEARYRLAQQQVRRAEELAKGGVAPRKELEAARAEEAAAAAAVARARQMLADLGGATIDVPVSPEEAAAVARVFQQDMLRIEADAAASVALDALPGTSFGGRVASPPAYVDMTTHLAPVALRVRDPQHALRPGMTGAAKIDVGAVREAVVVPAVAVVYDEAQAVVFVEEAEGHFAAHPVRLGVARDGRVEIVSGVEPGARVATTGAASLLSATRLPASAD